MVNELHSKLRRVEDNSSFEDNNSSAVKKDSNFTKQKLKKISKNDDDFGEKDKNYYAVFPALSRSEEKTLPKLTDRFESKSSSRHFMNDDKVLSTRNTSKPSKAQLCWSTLMSSAKEGTSSLTTLAESKSSADGASAYAKATKQRKKRRNVARNSSSKLLNKIDVQYNAKNYDAYHNATFLPKASKSSNKKHQRNCLGECVYRIFEITVSQVMAAAGWLIHTCKYRKRR